MRTAQFERLDHIRCQQSRILYMQRTAYRMERRLKDRTFADVLSVTATAVLASGQFNEITAVIPTLNLPNETSLLLQSNQIIYSFLQRSTMPD